MPFMVTLLTGHNPSLRIAGSKAPTPRLPTPTLFSRPGSLPSLIPSPSGGRAMLTAEGCRQRRLRFWQELHPAPDSDHLRLADPLHLNYLAAFTVDPISLNAGF